MAINLYVFSSANLTNIWAGIGARRWAVSQKQATNTSIQSKARSLPIGAFGIFYCVETKSLTTPFIVRSSPEPDTIIENIWRGPWSLPFGIVSLGSPDKQIHKDALGKVVPTVQSRNWDQVFYVSPITVFAPSRSTDEDWGGLIGSLAV